MMSTKGTGHPGMIKSIENSVMKARQIMANLESEVDAETRASEDGAMSKSRMNEPDMRESVPSVDPDGENAPDVPRRDAWKIVAVGTIVPLGLGCAAAATAKFSTHERVAMTAWIAVAIVGTASVIANAAAVRPRRHRPAAGAKSHCASKHQRQDV